MKKSIILILSIFALSSCVTKYPYTVRYSYFDYSEYNKKGFFITESNSVIFEYTPVGSISISIRSGYECEEKLGINSTTKDSLIYMSCGKYKEYNTQKAISALVNLANSNDANGIINLKVEFIPAVYEKGNIILGEGVIVSGMAIKK